MSERPNFTIPEKPSLGDLDDAVRVKRIRARDRFFAANPPSAPRHGVSPALWVVIAMVGVALATFVYVFLSRA